MKRFVRFVWRIVSTGVIVLAGILLLLTVFQFAGSNSDNRAEAVAMVSGVLANSATQEPLPPTTTVVTTPTNEPTETEEPLTPTATEPPQEIVVTVEPTVSVPTSLLNEGFAKLHIPAQEMVGVTFKTETKVVIVGGRETTVTSATPQLISSSGCNDFTKRDAVALVYLMSKKFGQSFKYTGPLIGSESAFIFFEHDGPNGECVANQNNAKAPAYCAGQIYQPNGAGGQTHPEFDLYPTGAEPRASLQDPVYCMAASMKVFRDDFGGNSVLAAANYKGFRSTDNQEFVNNYMPWYNGGSVSLDGITVPFVDDDNLIRSLLGPEIAKWEASIQDFYSKMPGFYGDR